MPVKRIEELQRIKRGRTEPQQMTLKIIPEKIAITAPKERTK